QCSWNSTRCHRAGVSSRLKLWDVWTRHDPKLVPGDLTPALGYPTSCRCPVPPRGRLACQNGARWSKISRTTKKQLVRCRCDVTPDNSEPVATHTAGLSTLTVDGSIVEEFHKIYP